MRNVLLALLVGSGICTDRASGVSCRDKTKCLTRSSCSLNDALYRSGHLCHGFPWYNGGAPFSGSLQYDNGEQEYSCLAAIGHQCVRWETRGHKEGKYQVGHTSCELGQFEAGRGYCKRWIAEQHEVELCSGEPSGPTMVIADGSVVHTECCHETCSDGTCTTTCTFIGINVEITNCQCAEEATVNQEGKTYCNAWTCVGTDNDAAKAQANETYECTEPHPVLPYCQAWGGVSDSVEEFKVSDCRCSTLQAPANGSVLNGSFPLCSAWTCQEESVGYYDPWVGYIGLCVLLLIVECGLVYGTCMFCGPSSPHRIHVVAAVLLLVLVVGTVFVPSLIVGGVIVLLPPAVLTVLVIVVLAVRRKRVFPARKSPPAWNNEPHRDSEPTENGLSSFPDTPAEMKNEEP
ncbi:hypothetical protein DIPPA_33033 [Diplonema papillatum]|nr:hypothetical protein DIPPA_33033 [Diplonema papillatum]